MNRIYKHIWSHVLGRLVVVPECARGAGGRKTGRRRQAALLASAMIAAPALAQDALPTGGQVVSGAATIETNGGAMTINQSSERLIADWQGFSIGAGNSVTFNQPGAASVALNRVTGQDVSQILGSLNANGQVFLVNPNGIVIGREGRVQTGAFVASTLGISNERFLSGTYNFSGAGGAIVNEGDIAGGRVALIAPTVVNAGTITGNTALAAGTDVLLDFDGDGLLSVEVKGSTMETLVENRGVIKADGGVAILTAKGASAAMKGVVNNTGTVEANAIGTRNGRILLLGDMQHGEAKVSGKLKAKEVETSAAKVKLDRSVKVETAGGHWLIDPTDIMIDADYAAVLQANLANGNVTIATASAGGFDPGNITISAPLAWGGNTLALIADNNIAINAALNSAAGGLTLLAGGTITADAAVTVGTFRLSAGSWIQNSSVLPAFHAADFVVNDAFLRVLGGDGSSAAPYSVADVYGLQGIATRTDYLGASWTLADDIDAAVTPAWRDGAGFVPIGTPLWAFTGHFDGRGHVVVGLAASHIDVAGLFGYTYGATIENVGTRDGRMFGALRAGGLVGQAAGTTLRNVHSGTTVVEGGYSGGVVGEAIDGTTITNVYSTNALSFGGYRGGIVGRLLRSTMTGALAKGSVSSTDAIGIGALAAIGAFSTMSSSYWDMQSGGLPVSSWVGPAFQATPLEGLEQSLSQAAYADFDFVNTWFMADGFSRPVLRSEWQSTINYAHQLQLMAMDLDADYTLGRDIDM